MLMDLFKNISFLIIIYFCFLKSNFFGIKLKILDYPDNIRKNHLVPIPAIGGVFFYLFIILHILFNTDSAQLFLDFINFEKKIDKFFFFLIFSSIFFISFLDDKIDLSPSIKLISLLIIISTFFFYFPNISVKYLKFSFYNLAIDLFNFSLIFTVIFFLFSFNSINMFDGINLQSSLLFLNVWTYIGLIQGFNLFTINVILFLLVFSYFNFKNKVFLGDCGVYLLSFLTLIFLLKIYILKKVFFDEIVLLFILPFVDLIRVVVFRIYNNKNPLLADATHFHHILISKFSFFFVLFIIILGYIFPIFLFKFININFFTIIFLFFIYYFFFLNFIGFVKHK